MCTSPSRFGARLALFALAVLALPAQAQTAVETSFEASEGYTVGSVANRFGWSINSGSASVSTEAPFVEAGSQGLRVATSGALRVDQTAFAGNVNGIGGVVYLDLRVNVQSLGGQAFTINGYDLYGGSRKRAFVVDLTAPTGGTGTVRMYDGFTSVPVGNYTAGAWQRITLRINYAAESYQLSLNAGTPVAAAFRESYTPSASGTRTAGERQYHALTFNLGDDTSAGSALVGIDRLYAGTTAPAGVNFPTVTPRYTLAVVQPSAGTVALSPAGTEFDEGTVVTLTSNPEPGFVHCGWTGDAEGQSASATLTVTRDLATRAITCLAPGAPVPSRTIPVASVQALQMAVANARPGDVIEMASGTYDIGTVAIRAGGVEGAPVVIRAATRGGVTLRGGSAFAFKKVAHVTVEGFVFTSTDVTAAKLESCSNCRLTRNVFRLNETASLKWVVVAGSFDLAEPFSDHNRIDHNRFENKTELGNFLIIDGSAPPNAVSSIDDRIDHNHFLNTGPRATNEKEAVRVGWSAMSLTSGRTVVEHNLFEGCDGDPEIISVKTSDDIIRYNTFRSSQGTLSVRHGNRTRVEGNVFLGEGRTGTGGIRFYGDDHVIVNNVMTGLTGTRFDAPIAVTNGDADYSPSTSDLTAHFRPRRALIAYNTLVGNTFGIEIGYTGSNYNRPPQQITFANNVVTGSENGLVREFTAPVGTVWAGNLMWPTGSATLGGAFTEAQARVVDPRLGGAQPWSIGSDSPARDAANVGVATLMFDVEGQARTLPDAGADEWAPGVPVLYRPLSASDVGPDAPDETPTSASALPIRARSALAMSAPRPNPASNRTSLTLTLATEARISVAVFDALGRRVAVLADGPLPAGTHTLALDTASLPAGLYLIRASDGTATASRPVTLVRPSSR